MQEARFDDLVFWFLVDLVVESSSLLVCELSLVLELLV